MELSVHHTTTEKQWTDIALDRSTLKQLSDLKDKIKQQAATAVTPDRQLTGLRALFYGPADTDKSFTAALLGNEFGSEVYRINISEVISKYIGETEKNLDRLFANAEDKGWILFFDEADALFGKRTESTSESDKYANQEAGYLLQRIEEYNGLVILSSNSKDNIDNAFIRRFHSVIHFPLPSTTKKMKQKS